MSFGEKTCCWGCTAQKLSVRFKSKNIKVQEAVVILFHLRIHLKWRKTNLATLDAIYSL